MCGNQRPGNNPPLPTLTLGRHLQRTVVGAESPHGVAVP